MSRKPETALRKQILGRLMGNYPSAVFFKIHGSQYQDAGIPDLICCIAGIFFGLEVKLPGEVPTKIQDLRIRQINLANGCATYVTSPQEALEFVAKSLDAKRSKK